jgi:uracil-DNA glycosylase
MTIDSLIAQLAQRAHSETVYNPYYIDNLPHNAMRRDNLRRYLAEMLARKPQHLLVLEAPGYRGARLTGVPVTSRKVLRQGIPELDMFGIERGYHAAADAGFETIDGEQSATIVWSLLASLHVLPLIWNAFPFHPHQVGKARSNRTPVRTEVLEGRVFLQQILALYQPQQIIAVGNISAGTLANLGIEAIKVRHPAQGGKADFIAGMTQALS